MFYFIPAWYGSGRPWYDVTEPWYRSGRLHFDDTINHLRLFEHAGQASQLVVLNYMPNLRYFLHQYDLFEVPTWSLFDQIQNISVNRQKRIDFRDLNWPEGAEFIYTPFLVLVRYKKKRLARVEFGQDGQLIWVDYFDEEVISYRYIFDDRGFVSSVIYYKDGKEHHQDYLNLSGQWQIREYLLENNRRVDIAPSARRRFCRESYLNIEELIKEFINGYLTAVLNEQDGVMVASHHQHNGMLLPSKKNGKWVLSYHQNRYDLTDITAVSKDALWCDLLIVDSQEVLKKLNRLGFEGVEHLSPFDTRLNLGKSQRLRELVVYFVIDGLEEEVLRECLADLFVAMSQNDQIVLHLVTYNHDQATVEAKRATIEEILETEEAPYLFLESGEKTTMFEVIEEEEEPLSRVLFKQLHSELSIQEALETARLIVDLSDYPDLYTQIAGISAGIPQVNKTESEFVEHMKNGYIVSDEADLFIALDYYLTGLANWNRSLICAVQKIEDYTSGRLVARLLDKIRENDR